MRVAERERSRESDFLRRQNEAVEQLKGLAAREQAAEQARRSYVDALPTVLQLIRAQHADEFADIKSQADVERMAKEDMPRYVKWSESQRQIGRAIDEVKAAQESALREAHVQVPGDMAVAGFDDIPMARYMHPPLSTVRVNISALGERATRRLLDAVANGRQHQKRRETLPVTLVIRESCGGRGQPATASPP